MSIYSQVIDYQDSLLQPTPWINYERKYSMIVIIPSYNEVNLKTVYQSIEHCTYDDRVGVVILINNADDESTHIKTNNQKSYDELVSLRQYNDSIDIYAFYVKSINKKKAGVGMARRLAMDQAVLLAQDHQSVIVNLDADCTVNSSYLSAIGRYFQHHPKVELANIHYEHPLTDERIIQYELHLRYYIEIQRYISLPYAYHTVGSSFAVRAGAYQSVGRMNLRKAGEDFYFIHKFTKKGTIGICPDAVVYPSARESDRVPFGTGRAMLEMADHRSFNTYAIPSFLDLAQLTSKVQAYYDNGFNWDIVGGDINYLRSFFEEINIAGAIEKIRSNTSSFEKFYKAFYQWLDAFKLMKYLHYMRDHQYPNVSVRMAALELLKMKDLDDVQENMTTKELLMRYRRLQSQTDLSM